MQEDIGQEQTAIAAAEEDEANNKRRETNADKWETRLVGIQVSQLNGNCFLYQTASTHAVILALTQGRPANAPRTLGAKIWQALLLIGLRSGGTVSSAGLGSSKRKR